MRVLLLTLCKVADFTINFKTWTMLAYFKWWPVLVRLFQ